MNGLITYNQSERYKITITSTHELRIKIPASKEATEEELIWTTRCAAISNALESKTIEFTLRGEVKHLTDSTVTLTSGKDSKGKVIRTNFICHFSGNKLVLIDDLHN